MKTSRYVLLAVLFTVSILAGGCGVDSSGIPSACMLSGACTNHYSKANGWNNCPGGMEAVFKAGDTPYGYSSYASYDVTYGSGNPVLGPDGKTQVIVPNPNDPSSLEPIAYCIWPGFPPPWPYTPVNGECQAPSVSYLQGTFDACPDHNKSHDCVCAGPGVVNKPTATYVPTPTGISFVPVYTVNWYRCVDKAKQIGSVMVTVPKIFNMTLTSGPNYQISKGPVGNLADDNWYVYVGPAGAGFTVQQCQIPPGGSPNAQQTNPSLCSISKLSYGTCTSGNGGGGSSGGGSCTEPVGGCPSGQFWVDCGCTTIK